MGEKVGANGSGFSSRLFGFLVLGFALIFIGAAILVIGAVLLGESGSVGGIILVGPIPIVFGVGPESAWLIFISLIVVVLSIVVFVLSRQRRKS
jgi:uncharacterized membrane protein